MNILVLNAGSSSQKSELYALGEVLPTEPPTPIWSAQLDWQDADTAQLTVKTAQGDRLEQTLQSISRSEALSQVLSTLWQGPTQVIPNPQAIDGVGHRVVHGGQDYQESVLVTPEVKAAIARLSSLAPNHNPANLEGIERMEQLLGDIPKWPSSTPPSTAKSQPLPPPTLAPISGSSRAFAAMVSMALVTNIAPTEPPNYWSKSCMNCA
jgi:acetate kinase